VSFKKKVNAAHVDEILSTTTQKELADAKFLSKFAKDISEGEECTLTCHLVECENSLGRSTVIDLATKDKNKFRQIDHRTINYIIARNVKYSLRKGAKKAGADSDDEADKKKDQPKWDHSKLDVGNTFSGTSYFKAVAEDGDMISTKCQGKDITISRDILECQMHNANVYATEEKLPLTKVAAILEQANTACFTVTFRCKVDDKLIKEKL
jgi:hypothetical protein